MLINLADRMTSTVVMKLYRFWLRKESHFWIDEITLLQEEFTLFPGQDDGHSQTEHWMAWLAAPDVAVDDNAMENL